MDRAEFLLANIDVWTDPSTKKRYLLKAHVLMRTTGGGGTNLVLSPPEKTTIVGYDPLVILPIGANVTELEATIDDDESWFYRIPARNRTVADYIRKIVGEWKC